jgi:hypothetical protein
MKITIIKRKSRGKPQITIKQRILEMAEKMAQQQDMFGDRPTDEKEEIKSDCKPEEKPQEETAAAPACEMTTRCSDSFAEMLANRNNSAFYDEQKKTMRDFADIDADCGGSVKTWGPKVTLEEIAGKPVFFWGFRISPSVKKEGTECLTMLLEIEATGEKVVLFTGSTVLSKLCLRYEARVPFRGRIIKVKNYYAFE